MSLLKPMTIPTTAPAPIAIGAAALLALTVVLVAPSAHANDLIVRYDQSQLIRLPRPAAEVIIGNPSIADVTIQGGNLLVVTGKTFGITNIIALDAQRNVIQDQRVLVERDDQRALVLYKGSMRESYTCTPMCAPTLTIGDETKFFETMTKHAVGKATVSAGSTQRSTQSATQ